MEKQGVSLLKRKNRWGLTVLCIVLAPLVALPLIVPQALPALPVALLLLLGYVGPVSMAVVFTAFLAICCLLLGAVGGLCAVLFLVPVVAVSVYAVQHDMAFRQAVGLCCASAFVSYTSVFAVLTVYFGTDVVSALSDLLYRALSSYGFFGDMLLSMLSEMGALTIPVGGFTAAQRAQALSEIVTILDETLRVEIPAQIAVGAFGAGVLGQMFLRCGLRARGEKTDFPPVRTWRLPKGAGLLIVLTLLALGGMTYLVPSVSSAMFYACLALAQQVFAMQGVAAMDWALHKRGMGKKLRFVLGALGYTVGGIAACILGIADQALDVTHRRENLGDKAKEDGGDKGLFGRFF